MTWRSLVVHVGIKVANTGTIEKPKGTKPTSESACRFRNKILQWMLEWSSRENINSFITLSSTVYVYLWAQIGASPAQWRAGTIVAHRAGLKLLPSNNNSYQGNQARTATPYVIYLFQVPCHLNKKKKEIAGLIIGKFCNLW